MAPSRVPLVAAGRGVLPGGLPQIRAQWPRKEAPAFGGSTNGPGQPPPHLCAQGAHGRLPILSPALGEFPDLDISQLSLQYKLRKVVYKKNNGLWVLNLTPRSAVSRRFPVPPLPLGPPRRSAQLVLSLASSDPSSCGQEVRAATLNPCLLALKPGLFTDVPHTRK